MSGEVSHYRNCGNFVQTFCAREDFILYILRAKEVANAISAGLIAQWPASGRNAPLIGFLPGIFMREDIVRRKDRIFEPM